MLTVSPAVTSGGVTSSDTTLNSAGVGVGEGVDVGDGAGVGVGADVGVIAGIGGMAGAAQAPSKITPIARTDNNFIILI